MCIMRYQKTGGLFKKKLYRYAIPQLSLNDIISRRTYAVYRIGIVYRINRY